MHRQGVIISFVVIRIVDILSYRNSSFCGIGWNRTNSQRFYRPGRYLTCLSQLKLSCGEPIFRFLLDSYSLLTIVHTVTVREPNLIFVPREGIEPPPFPCKRNTLPLRHRGKLYRWVVSNHRHLPYERSALPLSYISIVVDIGSSPIRGFPPNPSLPLMESNHYRMDQNHMY